MDKINSGVISGLYLIGISSFIIPITVQVYMKRKYDAGTVVFLIGAFAYMVISWVRGIFRAVILNDQVRESPVLFYFLSALLSGVFEEVGRYLVFRYVIPNKDRYSNAVSYGAGHAGFEIAVVSGVKAFSFASLCSRFNESGLSAVTKGMTDTQIRHTESVLKGFADDTLYDTFSVVFSVVTGLAGHIAFSVIVFTAVHYAFDKKYLFIAIALHTAFDFVTPFYASAPAVIFLIFYLHIPTIALVWFSYKLYKRSVT